MPSFPCRHPTCTAYVAERHGYCVDHVGGPGKQAYYDTHQRDVAAKAFYASAAWLRARAAKLAANPVCEWCARVFADTVHHKIPLKRCTEAQKIEQANLMSVCGPCHNEIEKASKA